MYRETGMEQEEECNALEFRLALSPTFTLAASIQSELLRSVELAPRLRSPPKRMVTLQPGVTQAINTLASISRVPLPIRAVSSCSNEMAFDSVHTVSKEPVPARSPSQDRDCAGGVA